jgi:hypothetical protein
MAGNFTRHKKTVGERDYACSAGAHRDHIRVPDQTHAISFTHRLSSTAVRATGAAKASQSAALLYAGTGAGDGMAGTARVALRELYLRPVAQLFSHGTKILLISTTVSQTLTWPK